MRICRFKRLKPPLPTHLSPSRFVIRRYSLAGEFEFGLDACGVSELVFYNSESTTPVDMTFRRNFNYTRLAVDEDGKSTFDPRFDFSGETSGKVPWKSVGLALFLLLFGCVLLLLSLSIFTGYMGGDVSQAYGLFGLGTLTFLPGFYETRIAYYSWRGAHGFHFAAIPGY
ncbi:putative transmembrane protein [Helianthus debilis subsp. tardiflorus]